MRGGIFRKRTWPVAFEHTNLQPLTPSGTLKLWIDVHVVFRWFQPYDRYIIYTIVYDKEIKHFL